MAVGVIALRLLHIRSAFLWVAKQRQMGARQWAVFDLRAHSGSWPA
jgi:hypothetical protein